jgi:hypothetical protein
MSDGAIMKKRADPKPKIDWSRANAMSPRQRRAAARKDPDAKPMTDKEWTSALRVARVQGKRPPR